MRMMVFLLLAATLAAQTQQPKPIQIPSLPQNPLPDPRPAAKTAPAARPPSSSKPVVKPAATKAATAAPGPLSLNFPRLEAFKTPPVETATLANGLKLYLLENRELPLIRGTAVVRTGNLFDPREKIGLAELTGTVMRSGGTSSRAGDELDEQLESIAASVESAIGETSGQVSFSCLAENADQVLAVFHDVLTEPAFRQDKLDLAKTRLRSSIARRNDEASGVAAREFLERLYGRDTPHGRRIEYEHLNRIDRADLVAFHDRYFFPANILLAVEGDFSAAEMKTKVEKLFGGWTAGQAPVPPFPEVRRSAAPGIFVAPRPEIPQSFFHLGHLGGRLADKDYAALAVMSDILGGSFASRLFVRIRTQMGWAYDVSANWAADYDQPGYFDVAGSTKASSTVQSLRAILEEIEKMRSAEVSPAELERARDSALNRFVFYFDTPRKTLHRLVTYEYYGYPPDFITRMQKAIASVTAADVLRVAQTHLKPKELTIVIAGDSKTFGRALDALERKVEEIDLTIAAAPRAAKTDPASQARARELVAKARDAVGGAQKLEAIQDYLARTELSLAGANGYRAQVVDRWVSPGTYRQDQQMPFGKITVYWDEKSGWIAPPQGGVFPVPPQIGKQASGEVFRFFFRLLLSDRDPDRTMNYLGDGIVEISDKKGNTVELHIDEATGLPRRQIFGSFGGGGAPMVVEESFLEWKEIDGLKTPWRTRVDHGGRPFAEVVMQECKFNSGMKIEELKKRP